MANYHTFDTETWLIWVTNGDLPNQDNREIENIPKISQIRIRM